MNTASATPLPKNLAIVSWIAQCVVAGLFLQTLFFKFTGAEESVFIFQQLGAEPWGRWASGGMELIAALLILTPRTSALGAILSLGVISGAILSHIFVLGIEVQGDGGLLFTLAVVIFGAAAVVVFLRRRQLPWIRDCC